MSRISPEQYIFSLIRELEQGYCSYSSFLISYKQNHLKTLKTASFENFLRREKELMTGILFREKTLRRWLKDFPALEEALSEALASLPVLRKRVVLENSLLKNEIASVMNSLKQEQKSLRVPRSKPIKKESAPSLIDIRL